MNNAYRSTRQLPGRAICLITAISNEDFYTSLRADPETHVSNWTVTSHAQPGDRVALYICAPVQAIVAAATVATEPYLMDDPPHSEYFGKWLVNVEDLFWLTPPIGRKSLRAEFYEWRYWRQPRSSIIVPGKYAALLLPRLI